MISRAEVRDYKMPEGGQFQDVATLQTAVVNFFAGQEASSRGGVVPEKELRQLAVNYGREIGHELPGSLPLRYLLIPSRNHPSPTPQSRKAEIANSFTATHNRALNRIVRSSATKQDVDFVRTAPLQDLLPEDSSWSGPGYAVFFRIALLEGAQDAWQGSKNLGARASETPSLYKDALTADIVNFFAGQEAATEGGIVTIDELMKVAGDYRREIGQRVPDDLPIRYLEILDRVCLPEELLPNRRRITQNFAGNYNSFLHHVQGATDRTITVSAIRKTSSEGLAKLREVGIPTARFFKESLRRN